MGWQPGIGLSVALATATQQRTPWRHRRVVPLTGMTADLARPGDRRPGAAAHRRDAARDLPERELSFSRLQEMLELTPGNLITHLRKLEEAGYLNSETTGNGRASKTSITLTRTGRKALDTYTAALRNLITGL